MNLAAADIGDCDGCRADAGRIFKGCLDCGIRNCARENKLESCAFCGNYPCEKLLKHFNNGPEARIRLEKIRQSNQN